MEDHIKKLIHTLTERHTPIEEQEVLIQILEKVPAEELESLVLFCIENPDRIHNIVENYSAKRAAFALKNANFWDQILRNEVSELETEQTK